MAFSTCTISGSPGNVYIRYKSLTTMDYWNALSSAMETYNASNWTATKYCIAMTALSGSQEYEVTVPALPADWYEEVAYIQVGGSPDKALDTPAAEGCSRYFDGTDWQNQVTGLASNVITTSAINDGAITDAKITVPTLGTGPATTILGMIVLIYRRWFGAVDWDTVMGILVNKTSGGGTQTTQTTSIVAGVQSQGESS